MVIARGQSFSEALNALKDGFGAQCKGWNGSGLTVNWIIFG